ncbi:MAG TPA: hypothetical protein VF609_11760 [Flavisolibacter sp.]
MKVFPFLLILCSFFFSCGSTDKKPAATEDGVTEKTLEAFADSLVHLDKFSLESIDAAAAYYTRLVPRDSTLADSAAVMFLRHVSGVVDTINQKLFQDTTDYYELVYNESTNAPEGQKRFKQNLERNHINLQADGEGGVYAVADYNWISSVLTSKTSAAVDAYLSLLTREEKTPALMDAGLAIEPAELADRLISSELLLQQRLPKSFADDVAGRNKFYTGTLLFGSVNSPALEYDPIALVEEYKKGYDYLLQKYPSSKAAQLLKEWQTIVAAKDSKTIEEWKIRFNPYYE